MQTAEIVLRTAAALSGLALTSLLFAMSRHNRAAAFGALYCLGVVAFVLTSTPAARAWPVILVYPLTLACVVKAAWFWLFAKALFDDAFRMRRRHWLVVSIIGAYGLWQQLLFSRLPENAHGVLVQGASLGFELLVLALVVLALREAYRGLSVDLVERRRRLRVLFVAAGGAYLAAATGVQAYNFILGIHTPSALVLANLGLMFVFSTAVAVSLLRFRTENWLRQAGERSPAVLGTKERRLLLALERLMENERIYREEGLTIGRLADRLGTREHQLRLVINRGLGFRNFNDFLHSYRIREASRRLGRSDARDIPVLSIALDVGYASIGPFNRAFKSRMGVTPTAFRKRAATEQSA